MPLSPRHYACCASHLHTSLPLRRYTAPPKLQSSIPPCFHGLHAYNAPLELHASTSAHLQRASQCRHTYNAPPRAPNLHASTSTCVQGASGAPFIHTSVLLHLQHASISIPPYLHIATLHRASRPPCLHVSMPPHHDTDRAAPGLHTSMLPRLHACSACIPTSISPHRCVCRKPPNLQYISTYTPALHR